VQELDKHTISSALERLNKLVHDLQSWRNLLSLNLRELSNMNDLLSIATSIQTENKKFQECVNHILYGVSNIEEARKNFDRLNLCRSEITSNLDEVEEMGISNITPIVHQLRKEFAQCSKIISNVCAAYITDPKPVRSELEVHKDIPGKDNNSKQSSSQSSTRDSYASLFGNSHQQPSRLERLRSMFSRQHLWHKDQDQFRAMSPSGGAGSSRG